MDIFVVVLAWQAGCILAGGSQHVDCGQGTINMDCLWCAIYRHRL